MSDKELTRSSGFLDRVQQKILIEDERALRGASLVIPAFTKGKSQLSQFEVEKSRQLARTKKYMWKG